MMRVSSRLPQLFQGGDEPSDFPVGEAEASVVQGIHVFLIGRRVRAARVEDEAVRIESVSVVPARTVESGGVSFEEMGEMGVHDVEVEEIVAAAVAADPFDRPVDDSIGAGIAVFPVEGDARLEIKKKGELPGELGLTGDPFVGRDGRGNGAAGLQGQRKRNRLVVVFPEEVPGRGERDGMVVGEDLRDEIP